MINKVQRSHPPLACTAVFLIGSTSCACWVLTAWPLNVKPRLGSKHKPWSLELCVCVRVQAERRTARANSKQQTCSKISWIYKLESYMWKSYALCQNLKANLTRRIIWIQNKTQSYKKNKDKHPDGRKIILPCGLQEVLGSGEVLSGFYMMEQFSGFMRPWGGDDRNIWFLFNKNNYLCNSTPNASFAVLMLRIQINKGDFLLIVSLYEALKWELWGKRAPCVCTEIVQLNFRNVLF